MFTAVVRCTTAVHTYVCVHIIHIWHFAQSCSYNIGGHAALSVAVLAVDAALAAEHVVYRRAVLQTNCKHGSTTKYFVYHIMGFREDRYHTVT